MMSAAASTQHDQQQLYGDHTRILWVEKGAMLLVTRGSMLVTAAVDTERMTGILLQEGECHLATRSGWLGIRCVPGPAALYATNVRNVASVICIDALPGAGWWRRFLDAFAAASKIRIALTRRS